MKLSNSILALVALTSSTALSAEGWEKTPTGIIVRPSAGPKSVRLELYGDRIVRVTESPDGKLDVTPSPSVIAQPVTKRVFRKIFVGD